ncbi:Uncharacterised protein [Candidatus Norongarragalina meridionalis]|nr:Uncharacterised protein [Candidatus Norongarragalina meridionalis]
MVSVYVKAFVITAVLFIGNFFFVKYLDDSRGAQLRAEMSDIEEQVQSSSTLLLYSQTFNDSAELCPILQQETEKQVGTLYRLFGELQTASEANVFTDTASIKSRFVLTNVQLWLYLQQLEKACGGTDVVSVLYFYPDKRDCLECRAQAQVLNDVTARCAHVRVFAFPTDTDVPVLQAIKAKYGVTREPTLVINDKRFDGLTAKDAVMAETGCA